jgi:hypothetical protein
MRGLDERQSELALHACTLPARLELNVIVLPLTLAVGRW